MRKFYTAGTHISPARTMCKLNTCLAFGWTNHRVDKSTFFMSRYEFNQSCTGMGILYFWERFGFVQGYCVSYNEYIA